MISVKGRRVRKTGPVEVVWVFRCKAHGRSFTVYPPGCVPYGRTALVHVTPEGAAIGGAALVGDTTYFGATIMASRGQTWPESSSARGADATVGSEFPPDGVRRTQRRRQRGAARLLGLVFDCNRVAERIAEVLGVPLLRLQDFRSAYGEARGWTQGAKVLVKMLAALPRTLALVDNVLRAGAIAGLWPHPRGCDPGRARATLF